MGLWDDISGNTAAEASRKAAADQYAKEQQAIAGLNQAGTQAQGDFQSISQGFNPYVQGGQGALQMLMSGLGLGGQGGSEAFTNAYQNLPGYQSGLNTGTNAMMRGLNAGGGLNRGAALKSLQRFGSDYENQRSGDYLSRLMGLGQQGLGATGQQIGTQGQGINANLGARQSAFGGAMNSAGTIGKGDVAAAQAQQTGMTNLLTGGAYLGGQALGGPLGKKMFA
jgi:hypothetical protein